MARRSAGNSNRGRNASPAVTAAKRLDKDIARAEARAVEFDEKAKAQRDSIEPLKAARGQLGDIPA